MSVSAFAYAFAVGKIRALEKFLIKKEAFEEAVGLSLEDSLKVLVESGRYSEELLRIKNSREAEELFVKESARLRQFIGGLIPDKGLLGFLELRNLEEARVILASYRSEFLSEYVAYAIDMHNIKSFLRLSVAKEPIEALKERLASEGFIKKAVFLDCYAKDVGFFLRRLEYVHRENALIDYARPLSKAITIAEREHSFVALEKATADFLIAALKKAKHVSFGPEPLVAYYFDKENEIKLMRMIILAKLNGASGELIKERLNGVYA